MRRLAVVGFKLALQLVELAGKGIVFLSIHPGAVNLEPAARVPQPSICFAQRGIVAREGEMVCLAHVPDHSGNNEEGKRNEQGFSEGKDAIPPIHPASDALRV